MTTEPPASQSFNPDESGFEPWPQPKSKTPRRPIRRDDAGKLIIQVPAVLSAPAHRAGKESELIVYLAARALDEAGSGRVPSETVRRELRSCWSAKHLARILSSDKSLRYWEPAGTNLLLRRAGAVLASFPPESTSLWRAAMSFSVAVLDTRQQRGAALLAPVLAFTESPRSNEFLHRFAGVDPQTVSRWQKDPVIRRHILSKCPQWVIAATHQRLPNRWNSSAPTERAPVQLQRAARSRPKGMDPSGSTGTSMPWQTYFSKQGELRAYLLKLEAEGHALRAVLGCNEDIYVRTGLQRWGIVEPRDAIRLAHSRPGRFALQLWAFSSEEGREEIYES